MLIAAAACEMHPAAVLKGIGLRSMSAGLDAPHRARSGRRRRCPRSSRRRIYDGEARSKRRRTGAERTMKANRALPADRLARGARAGVPGRPQPLDRIEVVSIDDGEVILYWELPAQAGGEAAQVAARRPRHSTPTSSSTRARRRRRGGNKRRRPRAKRGGRTEQRACCDRRSATSACSRRSRRSRATGSSRPARGRAYENVALPIACGQTISQPLVVARMLEPLELTADRPGPRCRDRIWLPRGVAGSAGRSGVDDRAPSRVSSAASDDHRLGHRHGHVRGRRRLDGLPPRAVRRDQRRRGHRQGRCRRRSSNNSPGGRLVLPVGTKDNIWS